MRLIRLLPVVLFVLGYLILGLVGTRTKMVFQWPSYILFGLAAVSTLVLIKRQPKSTPGTWCLSSMLLLVGYVVVRAAFSPVSYFARMEVAMVLAATITYLIFSVCLPRARYRLTFVGLLLALSFGNVLVGFYQLVRDPRYMILPGYERIRLDGAGGFFDNHNHLGGFLLVVVAFVLALALFGKMGPKMRVVVVFLVPVSILGIAMTASRGALLSLGVALVALLVLGLLLARKLYEYEFKKIAIIAGTLVLVALVPASFVGWKALGQRTVVDLSSGDGLTRGSDVRFTNWSLALDQWQAHPMLGQGSRMYDIYSVQHWPGSMNWVRGDPEFAHNDYLQMLGEYGVVGIALMLLFIALHVGSGLRYLFWYRREGFAEHRSRTHNDLALCLGALVVLAGYAMHSLLDFNLHLPANLVPVAFAFAVLANPATRSSGRRRAPRPLVLGTRLALPVIGAVMILGGFFYAPAEWHLEKARRTDIENFAEVISHADKSLEYDGRNFQAHQLRGMALMLLGFDYDPEELPEFAGVRQGLMVRASESLEEALALNEFDIFSLVGLGRCLDELGEHERAEELFVRATELGPWRREPHLRYGNHLMDRAIDQISTDLVGAMRRLELAKEEMEKSWNANERPTRGSPEDEGLKRAKFFLSVVYEEHGVRLMDQAEAMRQKGDVAGELAFLQSANEYLIEASREGRASSLRPLIQSVEKRLGELVPE